MNQALKYALSTSSMLTPTQRTSRHTLSDKQEANLRAAGKCFISREYFALSKTVKRQRLALKYEKGVEYVQHVYLLTKRNLSWPPGRGAFRQLMAAWKKQPCCQSLQTGKPILSCVPYSLRSTCHMIVDAKHSARTPAGCSLLIFKLYRFAITAGARTN